MKDKIKALRLDLGLTQKELANKIGSTPKSIWAYENGTAKPPYDVLIEYAKLFDVSTDYLLGLEDDFGQKVITSPDTYSKEERQLIEDYRTLSPALKKMLQDTIQTWQRSEANKKLKA